MKKEEAIHGETRQPLRWPDWQPRTRLGDRRPQAAWKHNYAKVTDLLVRELRLLKVTAYLITHNDIHNPDSGVSVHFSFRPDTREDWQEALGFIGTVPTVDEINRSYRDRARRVHPDGPSPNLAAFTSLTEHRDRAIAWARGTQTVEYEKVMAVDIFNEVRLNMNAIRLVLAALRQIERCGAPLMMDQAFKGFHKQITAGVGTSAEQEVCDGAANVA